MMRLKPCASVPIDYMAKPFAPEVLLNMVSRYLPQPEVVKDGPIVEDPASKALMQLAQKVAQSDASVMVLGPSGSGKEVMARYIHDNSARAEQNFVAINCAAIPENMLEATLFGYEKGAFTGAIQACPVNLNRLKVALFYWMKLPRWI